MRLGVGLAIVGLLAGAGAVDAQGARPQTREGFWIGFGFGYGSFGCDGCGGRRSGGAAYFRLGGSVNQHILLGAELNGWSGEVDGRTTSVGHVNTVIYLYPSATGGFHFKAGLGFASLELETANSTTRDSGGGILLGLGYDARVGRNFSLTPFLNLTGGNFDAGGDANTVQFGLGVSWH